MATNSTRNAKAAMGGIKKVPASVQLLETRLKSYDPEVRRQSYVKIYQVDAPEEPLVDKLVELIDHQNWYTRETAGHALAYCTDAGFAISAVRFVQERLEDEDPDVRRRAAAALVELVERANNECSDKIGAPEGAELAAASLAARLDHEHARVRQNVVAGLSKMGAQATPHSVALCDLVLDPDLSVRNEVIRMVSRLGSHVVTGASALARGLGHKNEAIRRSAKRALLTLSKVEGVESAQATSDMLQHEDADTRVATLDCLAELASLAGPHVPQMAELLEEMREDVRLSAVRAIICAGRAAQTHMKEVRRRLLHENHDVRRAAVQTLRGLASVCPKVPKVSAKDLEEHDGTSVLSLEVLGGAGALVTPYLAVIVSSLEEEDWRMRRAAIETLHYLEEHAVPIVPELCRRLVHHDAFVRKAAAEAVGRMGIHVGDYGHRVEALLATEEDQDVRQTCEEACQMLYAAGMAHG